MRMTALSGVIGQTVPDHGYADDHIHTLMATSLAGLQKLSDAAAQFCLLVGMLV